MAVSSEEQMMIDTVAEFIDHDVKPHVNRVEHADEYPEKWIQTMKDMGIYGLAIDEPWGDGKVSTEAYALITQELARGWMSLAGAMGGHTVVAKLIAEYGTSEQKDKYLPRMATGELRATMALTEPGGGSDLQAMRTSAAKDGEDYVINGSKTWITNARKSDLIALLCKTDPSAEPRHKGISIILVEKGEGFTVSKNLSKLGYKGVETCELVFENLRQPQSQLLGSVEGVGFKQMMKGLEIGRIQVASRSLGVAQAALNDAVKYSQERESMGKPIWRHQAVGNQLAKMATKLEAARQLVLHAARTYDSGERVDMEAGMAKYYASEMAAEVALDAIRVHGGYGYSTEYDVERYYRDAPLMIVGEGTNEIQLNVIAKQLIGRNKA
ncbi:MULTISPECIES: acyl-CoA dehydrogenase family protein [Brevibacterium]|uniref:Acyl-CoA dehydrogenase n=1 Tax=Brevibacterium aurantiacum TaxID=273384 RepID=A0A2A3ZHP9_BREAU|nr:MULTISPECIES: acyl-CoA dehydrogenase family protein [Brevibacterium]AZL11631.1 acyl-CoA dehydrogenase [Brevibacterium aurantiacum]MCF2586112.1 acyl-CoA dehydrogenase family protein [Brevibacterium sp. UCMA 11752]PCC50895.1 acyl-CoA dehydrogenase [Brevibacterium aurantiacum]